jgi:hypothetical protein
MGCMEKARDCEKNDHIAIPQPQHHRVSTSDAIMRRVAKANEISNEKHDC